jgi:hypothetical protein
VTAGILRNLYERIYLGDDATGELSA